MGNIDLQNCKKISIIGTSGSGKSTLAQKLGKTICLPVFHLDCLYWQPNWIKTDTKIFNKKLSKIIKNDKWIIDGLYKNTFETRFENSDLIIDLNFPVDVCIENIKNSRKSKEERIGVPEYLDESDDEIDYSSWQPFYEKYPEIPLLIKRYKEKVIIFNDRNELEKFLTFAKNL